MNNKIKNRYNIEAAMSSLNNYRKWLTVVLQTDKIKNLRYMVNYLPSKQASKQASKLRKETFMG